MIGIFFSGVSPRPVYLLVDNGRAELLEAGDIWGQDTFAAEQRLRAKHGGGNVRVACMAYKINAKCIGCRFCGRECPAEAIAMKPLSQMTAQEKLSMDAP